MNNYHRSSLCKEKIEAYKILYNSEKILNKCNEEDIEQLKKEVKEKDIQIAMLMIERQTLIMNLSHFIGN